MSLVSNAFSDVLDPRFKRIWNDQFSQLPDKVSDYYNVIQGKLQVERFSDVGAMAPVQNPFGGSVVYGDVYQGYDTTITVLEFAQGIQIERRLLDDDQFSIIDQKPKQLAKALHDLRQIHAARMFNNAFSVDNFFYNNSEGVALCSNSHTTTTGASTASGFDNLVTTPLSAVALFSAYAQMRQFKNDQARPIQVMPNRLLIPIDLAEVAHEIVNSAGKYDTNLNNVNFNKGMYSIDEWLYLTDSNNWFLLDMDLLKENGLIWVERIKGEFSGTEEFDTLVGKWRYYARHGNGHVNWRGILGAQVS